MASHGNGERQTRARIIAVIMAIVILLIATGKLKACSPSHQPDTPPHPSPTASLTSR